MRVMTWNILDGGQDDWDYARLALVLKVAGAHRPDVLVLNEAKHFDMDDGRVLYRVENELGLRGFLARAESGQHVVVFLRRDLSIVAARIDITHFHHALICLRIQLMTGQTLTVLGTHFCPHGSLNRLLEAQRVANYARGDEYVLLMGDLNSLDHYDDHRAALAALAPHYRARYVVPGEVDLVDTRVTRTLEGAGFVDIGHALDTSEDRFTAPTRLPRGGSEFSQMRVDYVYASAKLAPLAQEAAVIRMPDTDAASDHYPIIVDFDLVL